MSVYPPVRLSVCPHNARQTHQLDLCRNSLAGLVNFYRIVADQIEKICLPGHKLLSCRVNLWKIHCNVLWSQQGSLNTFPHLPPLVTVTVAEIQSKGYFYNGQPSTSKDQQSSEFRNKIQLKYKNAELVKNNQIPNTKHQKQYILLGYLGSINIQQAKL